MSLSLREDAREQAKLSRNYVVLTIASCVIATFGLIENSVAVIIGAMIVAPLMSPIQAFAFAVLDGDWRLVRRSLATACAGTLMAVATSAVIGAFVAFPSYGSEVLARTRPTLLDLAIAIAAGGVAGFAKVRPAIASTIAGTAIAVALMPPLCVVGLALSGAHWSWAEGAGLLFGTNFLGIALACMAVYVVAREVTAHNRIALVTTAVVTSLLIIPLGVSYFAIVRDGRIESEIRYELVHNTNTFRHINLLAATFDWYSRPVSAELEISASLPVSTSQVRDLESFVARRTGQPIRLVLNVSRYDVITDTPPTPQSSNILLK
jgi:uncharacterized hydrophobic protein (TIGR00271 family)